MPETEIEKKNDKWFHRIPELQNGRRFPSLAPDKANQLFEEILAAGEDAIGGIIDGLEAVDDGKDWKARFVLGALASHVGSKEREAARKELEKVFVAALQQVERPASVRTFLVMQLQWFGDAGCVGAVAQQLESKDVYLVNAAAATLGTIGGPAADVLKKLRKKVDEPARVAIDHALAQM